jgi:hypothetical protein
MPKPKMIYAVVQGRGPGKSPWYLWQLKDELATWSLSRALAKRMTNDEAGHAIDILIGLAEYDGVKPEDWRIENVGHG